MNSLQQPPQQAPGGSPGDDASNSLHGTEIRIVSKYGIMIKSLLSVSLTDDSLFIYWRSKPEKIGCEMSFLKRVTISATNKQRLELLFADFDMLIEFETVHTCELLCSILTSLIAEAAAFDKEHFIATQSSMSMYTFDCHGLIFCVMTNMSFSYSRCGYVHAVVEARRLPNIDEARIDVSALHFAEDERGRAVGRKGANKVLCWSSASGLQQMDRVFAGTERHSYERR
jgi:hypothetical protein